MSDYTNDFVILTDENGTEQEFEHIDTVEVNNQTYMAFIPSDQALQEETEVVILKLVKENGEDALVSVDDDEELDEVYGVIMDRMDEMEDELFDEDGETAEEEE